MSYLNKIYRLYSAVEKDPEYDDTDMEEIKNKLASLPVYFSCVIQFNSQMAFLQSQYKGEEFRDKMSKTDSDRRAAHERMTIAINYLNRLCVNMDVPKIFDVEDLNYKSTADRAVAAEVCYEFCTEIFSGDRRRNSEREADEGHHHF